MNAFEETAIATAWYLIGIAMVERRVVVWIMRQGRGGLEGLSWRTRSHMCGVQGRLDGGKDD